MQPDTKKYLFDIKTSIQSIDDFIGDRRIFADYQNNKLLKRAVERELEIIGEALNNLLKIDPFIGISDARKIVDTRNWVIHGYDNVDDIIIWGIITKNLPVLFLEVKKLLGD
jgi:uncharacterized protein with HEPN domain